jgi:hypothetical protein
MGINKIEITSKKEERSKHVTTTRKNKQNKRKEE